MDTNDDFSNASSKYIKFLGRKRSELYIVLLTKWRLKEEIMQTFSDDSLKKYYNNFLQQIAEIIERKH